jgi:hypothetical protein
MDYLLSATAQPTSNLIQYAGAGTGGDDPLDQGAGISGPGWKIATLM